MWREQSSVVSARCGSTELRNCKLLASLNYGFCLLRDLIDVIVCELSPSVRITSRVPPFCLEFIKGSEATLQYYRSILAKEGNDFHAYDKSVSG